MNAQLKHTPLSHSTFMPGYALDGMMKREVDELVHDLKGAIPPTVSYDDLGGLPEPVGHYLRAAGIVGKPRTLFTRMRFEGDFRRGREHKWMPMVSEQYNRIDEPVRLWYASMRFLPLMNFFVRDAYVSGEGHMYARLTPWYRMFDERAPELTQGELLVVLNDMVFFPSALLSDYIRWEAVDDHAARATLTANGMSVSAVFYFNQQYDVVDFVADRYQLGKPYKLGVWSTPFSGHQTVNGVRIPTFGEARWNEKDGSYAYARMTLVDIQTNVFARYP